MLSAARKGCGVEGVFEIDDFDLYFWSRCMFVHGLRVWLGG